VSGDLSLEFRGLHDGDGALRSGLWSLLDMMNFTFSGLAMFLELLAGERVMAAGKAQQSVSIGAPLSANISDDDRKWIAGLLGLGTAQSGRLELEATYNRIERVMILLRAPHPIKHEQIANELKIVKETADDELRYRYFYYYPIAKAKKLRAFEGEWSESNASFPLARESALNATDCYAIGQSDACVFHCMHVLESGLRVLARNVGLTFDTQQWKNIIDEIETKIGTMRDNGIHGVTKAEKDKRLQFLSEAAKEFFYFKDGWRNFVAHGRDKYDEHKALSVLEHTRAFMNHLASQLSERGPE
jgi:hypothetical protein